MAAELIHNMQAALAQHQQAQGENSLERENARRLNHLQNDQTIQELEIAIAVGRDNNILHVQAYVDAATELYLRKAERVLYLADVSTCPTR